MNWSDFRLRLRALFFRHQMEDELDEELQFHLAMESHKNLERGLDSAQAKRRVNLRFGGLEKVKEECRETRGVRYIENFVQDVRYALQGLRRTPGFAVTVIATIALGLGLNTALFTILNAYVLQPLKVHDPNSMYQFTWARQNGEEHQFSRREFEDFRKQNPAFADVIATNQLPQARVEGHLMLCQLVSDNYFPMLGVGALRGRTLIPEDVDVAVLSVGAWTKKFDNDPNIIGKRIVIYDRSVEVVGVAQPGFRGVGQIAIDIWLPLSKASAPEPLTLIGRLREDFTLSQAQSALTAWMRRQTDGRPRPDQATRVILRSRATILSPEPELVAAIAPIMVAFGLVLLVACANVANMMLARGMARQREIGIRLAMGAGRSRLIAQLLTESLVLAVPSAAGGFLISQQSLRAGQWLLYNTMPAGAIDYLTLMPAFTPDIRVFGFMLAGAFLCALLFGLLPAMQSTRSNVLQAARGEFTTDFRPARLRDALVIAQVTVSVVLLVCSAVLLRANSRLQNIDAGLEMNGVIELKLQEAIREKVVRQLGADPGVQTLAAASKVPFMGSLPRVPVVATEGAGKYPAGYLYASPEYFQVFQVPILRGRNFTREEATGAAAVAVVSQATALRLWPGREALGQSLRIQLDPQQARSLADPRSGPPKYSSVRVIGIARDAANGWVGDGQDQTCIYFPTTALNSGNVLFARSSGDAEVARRRLDVVLAASLPGAVTQISSMQEIRDAQLYPFRAAYWISMAVGGLALLLTLTGIYGVLSYVVTQRTKEIGIRVALGARPGSVAGLILKQSLRFAVIGALIGSFGALGMIRAIASQVDMRLFAFDTAAFAMGLLLVIAASAAAAWVPSRRAAHIEPVSTLRCD